MANDGSMVTGSGRPAQLPAYDELPEIEPGLRSAWGVFGADDSVGLLNLQTPEVVRASATLVKRGAVFNLSLPLDAIDPPLNTYQGLSLPERGLPQQRIYQSEEGFRDDAWDNLFTQASSQWDTLAHVPYRLDSYYNGASCAELTEGRNTIDHWARRGIVGRGVLLDVERARREAGRPFEPASPIAFQVEDLDLARERAGVDLRAGDILCLRTGFVSWYLAQSAAERHRYVKNLTVAGIAHTEEMARWLWDSHISGIATDNFAVEVWPPDWELRDGPIGFLHRVLIGLFGMALGELWWLEDLAADCASDGVHEFMLVSAPLHLRGGVGSPANALAIK